MNVNTGSGGGIKLETGSSLLENQNSGDIVLQTGLGTEISGFW